MQALKDLLNGDEFEGKKDEITLPKTDGEAQLVRASSSQQNNRNFGSETRQQTIEQKNKQIAMKNTNLAASSQRNFQASSQQQYYNNN